MAPTDPWTFASLAAALGAVALAASWLPARRAAHQERVPVLRTL